MWFLKGKFYPKLCHFWSEGGSSRLLEEPARSQFDVFSTLVLHDKEHMVFHRITQCYLNTKGLKYTWGLAVLVFDKTKGKPLLSLVKDKTKCPSGFFFFFPFTLQVCENLRLSWNCEGSGSKEMFVISVRGKQCFEGCWRAASQEEDVSRS